MNQFCDDLKLGHLATTAASSSKAKKTQVPCDTSSDLFPERMVHKKNTKAKTVEDLVIHVAAGSMPYSILTAFTQLATRYKCFIQFFVHGSAASADQKKKIQALQELFDKLKLNLQEGRSCYDYSVTLIWKKSKLEKNDSFPTQNSVFELLNLMSQKEFSFAIIDQIYQNHLAFLV